METQSRRREPPARREPPSAATRVALVADAALELTPEQLADLRIAVVPREALIGRRRKRLDADYSAASLALEERRPRKVAWRSQDVETAKGVYARQAASGAPVLAFHPPLVLDEGTRQARRARNFLWPAPVHLLELPLLGMGQARVVELLARFAAQGVDSATLLALTHFLATVVKTLVIIPARERSEQFVDASDGPEPRRSRLLGGRNLLCEIRKEDGRLQILDAPKEPADCSEKIGRYVTHMGSRRVPLQLTWRASRYDKQLDSWRAALDEQHIVQETTSGWSPHVTANLGLRWLEICLAPPHKDLVNLARQYQQRFERLRQASDVREPARRLSDYRLDFQ